MPPHAEDMGALGMSVRIRKHSHGSSSTSSSSSKEDDMCEPLLQLESVLKLEKLPSNPQLLPRRMVAYSLNRKSSLTCLCVLLVIFTGTNFVIPYIMENWVGDAPLSLVVRVKPDRVEDDLSTGKSCVYRYGRWYCRDCGDGSSGNCKLLYRRRSTCSPFAKQDWDSPPRSFSQYDSTSNSEVPIRGLSTAGRYFYTNYFYDKQPMCTVDSCFDLSRCSENELTVFVNNTNNGAHALLDFAVAHSSNVSSIRRVYDHEEACLVLVTKDTYKSMVNLKASRHWQGEGKNHLIWDMSMFQLSDAKRLNTSDTPFSLFHVDKAAVASESLTLAHLRAGYDLVTPLARQWPRPESPYEVNIHKPRRWLLGFRGSIQDSPHPYYQHRWLAAAYWEDAPDVFVDVQCLRTWIFGAIRYTVKNYRHPPSIYPEMMRESTFGFAPGGSGVGSYRFGEILSAGGIPVVTQDLVLPLSPEIDWTGCVVRVSEARIIDLPRILREFTPEEIRDRQTQCWTLLQTVIGDRETEEGWLSDERVTFAKAMEVWAARVSTALYMNKRLAAIRG